MKCVVNYFLLLTFAITNWSHSQTFVRSELPMGLVNPWEITYGPDGFLWLSESGGKVIRVDPINGGYKVAYQAPDYYEGDPSESLGLCFDPVIQYGTLGLTLHPDFLQEGSRFIYLYYSYNSGTEFTSKTAFKIKRLEWDIETNQVIDNIDIVTNIPSSYDHIGGRLLAVKQNGKPYLFLTVGDHGLSAENSPDCYEDQADNPNNFTQDISTANGKVHRFNMDGSIPADNPVAGNSFYTRGHRNPQGLMFNNRLEILYNVEHGDRTDDEINVLLPGRNYGWKDVRGYHDGNHTGEMDVVNSYTPHPEVPNDELEEAFYSWCDSPVDVDPGYLNWCTVAPSDGIYYGSNAIPEWENSLLVVTLKNGDVTDREVFQFKLQEDGSLMPSTPENPNPSRFFGEDQEVNGRLRDIAISPDGRKIYLINNFGAEKNKIIVYTYVDENPAKNDNCATLYPNPATNNLQIRDLNKLSEVETMLITSSSGEIIELQVSDWPWINIEGLAAGTYTLSITHSEGVCVQQFVKL